MLRSLLLTISCIAVTARHEPLQFTTHSSPAITNSLGMTFVVVPTGLLRMELPREIPSLKLMSVQPTT